MLDGARLDDKLDDNGIEYFDDPFDVSEVVLATVLDDPFDVSKELTISEQLASSNKIVSNCIAKLAASVLSENRRTKVLTYIVRVGVVVELVGDATSNCFCARTTLPSRLLPPPLSLCLFLLLFLEERQLRRPIRPGIIDVF